MVVFLGIGQFFSWLFLICCLPFQWMEAGVFKGSAFLQNAPRVKATEIAGGIGQVMAILFVFLALF